MAGCGQASIEIVGGADQRQVSKGLREVSEMLRPRAELLAVQPEMVGIAEHLLEEEPRLLKIPHAGEALDVPERTHGESALLAGEAVRETLPETIAIDERVAHQLSFDAGERRQPAGVGR